MSGERWAVSSVWCLSSVTGISCRERVTVVRRHECWPGGWGGGLETGPGHDRTGGGGGGGRRRDGRGGSVGLGSVAYLRGGGHCDMFPLPLGAESILMKGRHPDPLDALYVHLSVIFSRGHPNS